MRTRKYGVRSEVLGVLGESLSDPHRVDESRAYWVTSSNGSPSGKRPVVDTSAAEWRSTEGSDAVPQRLRPGACSHEAPKGRFLVVPRNSQNGTTYDQRATTCFGGVFRTARNEAGLELTRRVETPTCRLCDVSTPCEVARAAGDVTREPAVSGSTAAQRGARRPLLRSGLAVHGLVRKGGPPTALRSSSAALLACRDDGERQNFAVLNVMSRGA